MSRLAKTRKSARPRANRGALTLIALLLAGSGVVRLGTGSGEAIAREFSAIGAAEAAVPEGAICKTDEDVKLVLEALGEREARIAEDDARVEARLAELAEAEAEMEATLAELVEAEEQLSATLAQAQTAAEDDLARLTTVYETMKPKDAAALFERMAPEFAAGFLGRMNPAAAAEVMTGLMPETAYTISVVMAGRNANAPKQ
ncbi:MotE family protein [Roseitranquillus sediminis]|uniref:MotE family protein n=1 Tax=Roseitranquillus sediminis TaxID=2809051 RepID=UPI001D0C6EE8|nr:hypothetical protein [Roseitranquillus sediminis]MBM9596134.1 hypothetical protein [Roseitranquillus sediminis]